MTGTAKSWCDSEVRSGTCPGLRSFQESDLRTLSDQPLNYLAQIAGGEELVQATQAAHDALANAAVLPAVFDNVQILIGAVVGLEGFDAYEHSTSNFCQK